SAGGQPEALHAADANEVSACGDRLDDIGSAAECAVNHEPRASAHGFHDLRQHLHGAASMIELPAAMIGYVNPFDPVIDGDAGVLGGGYALDRERDAEALLDTFDRVPVERGLKRAALHAAATGGDEALGNVALAPAVMGGIDGEAEARIAVGDRAFHVIV